MRWLCGLYIKRVCYVTNSPIIDRRSRQVGAAAFPNARTVNNDKSQTCKKDY